MMQEKRDRKLRKLLGRYIVVDSSICHGKPTFRGTRIFVKDVLDQVASGMAWDAIIDEWHGSITRAAIAEAVRLARDALLAQKEGTFEPASK
jgi:uncharacterized protein (DUF433 family)